MFATAWLCSIEKMLAYHLNSLSVYNLHYPLERVRLTKPDAYTDILWVLAKV